VPAGFFPNSLEKEATAVESKVGGGHSSWTTWERGRRGWELGEKRVSRLNTWGIIGHYCCPGQSCPRTVLEHWNKEWLPLSDHGNHEGSIRDLIVHLSHSWRGPNLATFGTSGQVRKLHLQPSDDTEECSNQNILISWRETFLSTSCPWTSS
jgi:hypothetical protein